MKYLFILLTAITTQVYAQPVLNFDKRFVECEDQWVALKSKSDSIYNFGFIYIDATAGLTLDFAGTFTIAEDGTFLRKKSLTDTVSIKYRLEPNQQKVAIIPTSKLKELQVTAPPVWLSSYKGDTNSIQRLHRWGFYYNHFDECSKALTYLEKGYKKDPTYKGMAFELAYSYNCLKQYQKAIPVLKKALETSPQDCLLYKELSYAQMHIGEVDKAAQTCKTGIPYCTDNAMKSELAYNIAFTYYEAKDKANFKSWADQTRKWATKGDRFLKGINAMEIELAK